MKFRQGFILIEEENGWANVTNDGWHVCGFMVDAKDQREFEKKCELFLTSAKFHLALAKQQGKK